MNMTLVQGQSVDGSNPIQSNPNIIEETLSDGVGQGQYEYEKGFLDLIQINE